MEKLKLAAKERGLSVIIKRKIGPFIVMEDKTGRTVGSYSNADDAWRAVLAIEPLPVIDAPEFVKWNSDVIIIEVPKQCSNGHGPTCLCLDVSAIYLCAVPECNFKAGCRGCCNN